MPACAAAKFKGRLAATNFSLDTYIAELAAAHQVGEWLYQTPPPPAAAAARVATVILGQLQRRASNRIRNG
jgi:hypothetical protein